MDGNVGIRRPVRADVDAMLCRFLEIEKHVAAEYAKERRRSKSCENVWKNEAFESVVDNIEGRAKDRADPVAELDAAQRDVSYSTEATR